MSTIEPVSCGRTSTVRRRLDGEDTCRIVFNAEQLGGHGDGIGDGCDDPVDTWPADVNGDDVVTVVDLLDARGPCDRELV